MTPYFRPNIARMAGYVPGEQPRDGGFIKLNTNENPVSAFAPRQGGDRRGGHATGCGSIPTRCPPRSAGPPRGCTAIDPEMVLAGNGSDDVLTIVTRAFVGPGDPAAFATPSYLLYSTLIQLQDGRAVTVPYSSDWTLDLRGLAVPGLKLVYIANPDSPSGTAMTRERIAEVLQAVDCPVLVDEAYGDFADPRYHSIPCSATIPT